MSRVPSTEVASLPYTSRDWTLQDICHPVNKKRCAFGHVDKPHVTVQSPGGAEVPPPEKAAKMAAIPQKKVCTVTTPLSARVGSVEVRPVGALNP